ncbi:winged helix DNA-binding domain-containing protein [Bosea caraganae]|uniref:Winged helix DNA-binding domain-containing protein n=1 Tax=Bosea caraganae TaxID=2763117 RepID=A0A370LA56_9HYPH|nr:crosslink repair DNA glycosylase YcaQ family protein [Bosea caraganae]RDJ21788.1 winged helix DNA-binding domain-containing protein [Bosea caraganae]RDJ28182.1 winged helix DNA-binding domain-containing protein [Bosea caraganae]
MAIRPRKLRSLTRQQAKQIWLRAQRLDTPEPFGSGPEATRAAVEHLGYVQIDTINVIERCHHHILYSRIPAYERAHLRQAQSLDKSVFEYWTHALSYIPTRDIRFFLGDMKLHREKPEPWYASVGKKDMSKVMTLLRHGGPLTIRDIDDDVLIEKDHAWASKKPSKRALQLAFYNGVLTVSERNGMLKTYDLMDRHFGWEARPKPVTEKQRLDYLLDRALRTQGLISLDSACHLDAPSKPGLAKLIASRIRKKKLVPVALEGPGKTAHWGRPELLEEAPEPVAAPVHILSPFDPLIIQRKRLQIFFGYDHRFEAYVPKEKRVFGYFALPVLVGDEIAAVLDLKTDRAAGKLLIQQWTWIKHETPELKRQIEEELSRFERFQLGS